MYFNVSRLMREHSGSSRTFEVDECLPPIDELDDRESQRVVGAVKLLRTDKGVWVSAVLDSEVPCTCSRCLNEYSQHIRISIEEEVFPSVDPINGVKKTGLVYPEESFSIDQDNVLDLTEAVRQYSALSLPMKPVCSVDCKGICLDCGASLNESPCRCGSTPRNNRWGLLLDLVSSYQINESRER